MRNYGVKIKFCLELLKEDSTPLLDAEYSTCVEAVDPYTALSAAVGEIANLLGLDDCNEEVEFLEFEVKLSG